MTLRVVNDVLQHMSHARSISSKHVFRDNSLTPACLLLLQPAGTKKAHGSPATRQPIPGPASISSSPGATPAASRAVSSPRSARQVRKRVVTRPLYRVPGDRAMLSALLLSTQCANSLHYILSGDCRMAKTSHNTRSVNAVKYTKWLPHFWLFRKLICNCLKSAGLL